jgi:hypothetical protein
LAKVDFPAPEGDDRIINNPRRVIALGVPIVWYQYNSDLRPLPSTKQPAMIKPVFYAVIGGIIGAYHWVEPFFAT